MTTKQEGILIKLQSIIDNLKEANHWHEVDNLAEELQDIKNDLEDEL